MAHLNQLKRSLFPLVGAWICIQLATFALAQEKLDPTARSKKIQDMSAELNFAMGTKVIFDSHSSARFGIAWEIHRHLSQKSMLLSILALKNVAKEIELSKSQQSTADRLIKEVKSLETELLSKFLLLPEAPVEDFIQFKKRIETERSRIDREIDEILLPHQIDTLQRILANYLAAAFGYAEVLHQHANTNALEFADTTIARIKSRESDLIQELEKRRDDFISKEIERLSNVLDEKQNAILSQVLKETSLAQYPELLAAQAKEASEKSIELKFENKPFYEFATRGLWIIEWDGTMTPKFNPYPYNLLYLVSQIAFKTKLNKQMEPTVQQDAQLKDLYDQMVQETSADQAELSESPL